jgi:hypothetical protein
MAHVRVLLAGGLALGLAGCGDPPPSPPKATTREAAAKAIGAARAIFQPCDAGLYDLRQASLRNDPASYVLAIDAIKRCSVKDAVNSAGLVGSCPVVGSEGLRKAEAARDAIKTGAGFAPVTDRYEALKDQCLADQALTAGND